MNQGVVGRVLIKKTACKKSRVSVPLKTDLKKLIWEHFVSAMFYSRFFYIQHDLFQEIKIVAYQNAHVINFPTKNLFA